MDETEFRYINEVIAIVHMAERRAATRSIQILKFSSERSNVSNLRNIWTKNPIIWNIEQPSCSSSFR